MHRQRQEQAAHLPAAADDRAGQPAAPPASPIPRQQQYHPLGQAQHRQQVAQQGPMAGDPETEEELHRRLKLMQDRWESARAADQREWEAKRVEMRREWEEEQARRQWEWQLRQAQEQQRWERHRQLEQSMWERWRQRQLQTFMRRRSGGAAPPAAGGLAKQPSRAAGAALASKPAPGTQPRARQQAAQAGAAPAAGAAAQLLLPPVGGLKRKWGGDEADSPQGLPTSPPKSGGSAEQTLLASSGAAMLQQALLDLEESGESCTHAEHAVRASLSAAQQAPSWAAGGGGLAASLPPELMRITHRPISPISPTPLFAPSPGSTPDGGLDEHPEADWLDFLV